MVEEVATPPAEPPAEGAQLAAGRLGSVLEGLAAGTWELPGEHGRIDTGPDVPSDHTITRTTSEGDYVLHIVAWETFKSVPEGPLGRAAVARAGEGATLLESNNALGVAATFPQEQVYGGGPEDWMYSNGAHVLVQLSVAVRDGTFVSISLGCDDTAACRAEDPQALAQLVASSLRRGPTLQPAVWEFRVPRGPGSDKRIRIGLPDGFVGLAARPSYRGEWTAPVIALASGRSVMSVRVSEQQMDAVNMEPGAPLPDEVPTSVRFDCAPFRCYASFPRDETMRAQLAASFAAAEVENIASDDTGVAIGGGRLTLRAEGPVISRPDRDYDELVESYVRHGDQLVHLRVRDTLRPGSEAFGSEGYFQIAADRSNVIELESGDPTLSITRVVRERPESGVAAQLLVSEQDGTGLIVDLLCHYRDDECKAAAPALSTELAQAFRRGTPVATTRQLNVTLADLRMRIELPEGYVTSEWFGEHHGGWGIRAHNTRGAVAVLEFEDGGAAQGASIENTGRRTGRRTTLRLGEHRFVMRERRRSYDNTRVWGADLRCGGACVVLITTSDLAERDRLLEALANARVTRIERTPCLRGFVFDDTDDSLNLREGPSTSARVLRAIENDTEVTIERQRGRWLRLAAPNEGWVWSEGVTLSCD